MALKFKLDSLDGLDDGLKPLYLKGDDGKFTLQLDDDPAKSTMQKLRQQLADAEKALKDRETAEATAKAAKEREELERKGDYEKLSAADKAALKAAEEKATALEGRIRNGVRDRAALEAIQSANGISKALLPHITPNLEVIPDGDDFRVVVKGDAGKPLAEYISSLKTEMPWGFNGSGASGSGSSQSGSTRAGAPASMVRAAFDQLNPTAKRAYLASGGIPTD